MIFLLFFDTTLGEKVSLADMALAPFLDGWQCVMREVKRIDPSFSEDELKTQCPRLYRYRLMMHAQPYATATAFKDDEYAEFIKIYRAKDEKAVY